MGRTAVWFNALQVAKARSSAFLGSSSMSSRGAKTKFVAITRTPSLQRHGGDDTEQKKTGDWVEFTLAFGGW